MRVLDLSEIRVLVESRPMVRGVAIYVHGIVHIQGVPTPACFYNGRINPLTPEEEGRPTPPFVELFGREADSFCQQLLDGLHQIGIRPPRSVATEAEIVSAKDATIAAKDAHIEDLTNVLYKVIGPALRKAVDG